MARKIYNNTYYDDSSPLSTLFQTGVFATGVGAGIKYRNQILDKVAPVTQAKLSPYLQTVMRGKEIIGANASRASSMRDFNSRIIEEQAQRLSRVLDSRGARIVSPKGSTTLAKSLNFGYGDLDDVVDAAGNKIGAKVQEALKGIHGSATFAGMDGTVATFAVGDGEIKVPFAKFNEKAGAWQTNVGGTINTAPIMGETVQRGDNVGMRLLDYNTYLAESIGDLDKRLILMNDGIGKQDVDEARKLGNSAVRKQAHFMNAVNQKIIIDQQSASDSQRVLNGIYKNAEFTHVHDVATARRVGTSVAMDPWSRMQVAEKMGHAGFDSTHVTSAAMGSGGLYSESGIMSYWNLPSQVRENPSLLSVGTAAGELSYDEAMASGLKGMHISNVRDYLGFTGSQSQVAKGHMTIRPTPYTLKAEGQKAEKALMYGINQSSLNSINGGMGSYGIAPGVRDAMRFNSIVEGGYSGGDRSAMNMLTFLDNSMPSERISIDKGIYSRMNTRRHIQENMSGMLSGRGNYIHNMSAEFTFNFKGNQVTRDLPLGRLAGSAKLRALMSQEGSSINIAKGTYLGVNANGAKISNMSDMARLLENPDSLVTATDHLLVQGDNLKDFINSVQSDKIKLLAQTEALPTKLNAYGTGWRGVPGVHAEFAERSARIASLAAGQLVSAEAIVQADMFDKILPKAGGVVEKGTTELVQFLQNSIAGHAMHYSNTPLMLEGEAAATMSNLLARGGGESINLTKLATGGDLMFKGALRSSPEALGEQIGGLAGVLGAIRETIIGGQVQPINKITDGHINGLRGQWDAFKSANAAAASGKTARQASWAMWNGWMASEQMTQAQGAGFQSLRVSMKDMPSLIGNMPHTLAELSLDNRNNSGKMVTELSLMQQTWGDSLERGAIADIAETKAAYKQNYGDIPILSKQQAIDQMLGGLDSTGIYSAMKDNPEHAMRSLLSSEVNPTGFLLADFAEGERAAASMRYIPSAEFLGNAFGMADGEVTTQNFARRMLEGVAQYATTPEGHFSESMRTSIQAAIISDSLPQAGGFNNVTGMNVSGAIYSKHTDDVKFLQNMELDKGITKLGGKVETMFGNTIVQHSADYENVVKQALTKYSAMGDTADVMESMLGQGNFFEQYYDDIWKMGSAEGDLSIDKVTKKIVGHQSSLAREAQDMFKLMAETGDAGLADDLERVMQQMMHGVGVRHPNIYQGSYGLGVIMPDINNSLYRGGSDLHKQSSFGKIHRINQTADVDGDAHTLRALFSKQQRIETWERMYTTQKEAAHWMTRLKDSTNAMPAGVLDESFDLSKNLTSLARELQSTRPEHSALASFFTKAMTGSMSVRAAQLKAGVRASLDESRIGIEGIAKAENYFMTTISGITEQGTISSKHLQGIIGQMHTMDSVTGLMGATFNSASGRKAIRTAISQTNTVHPLIMMAWGGLRNTNEGEASALSSAVETALDIQSNAKQVSQERHLAMSSEIYGLDDAGSAKAYTDYLDEIKGKTMFFDTPEARAMGIQESDSFMEFLRRGVSRGPANFERGVLSTENINEVINSFQKASKAGFTQEAVDAELGAIMRTINSSKKYTAGIAMESFLPKGAPGALSGRARRRLIGLDKIADFIDTALTKVTPGKAAIAIGGGLLSMRAYNIMTGDGSPESPEDLPSYNNPSMEKRGNRMVQSPRTLSSIPNLNSDSGLLTDNGMTHEEAMSFANQRGYVNEKSNSVSVRSDGHNPYKSDMIQYE